MDDLDKGELRPTMRRNSLFSFRDNSYHADHAQNFLRKGYHEAAEQAEEALGPLAGVVGLKAHAHLHDPPAQNDDAQGLSGEAVHLADNGAPDLAVGDLQSGGAAVLHFDLVGLAVQAVALGGFQLRHLIPALVGLGQSDNAGTVRGIGADNLAVELADLKLNAADTLPGFLILLDDGKSSNGRILKGDGLGVVGVHLDRLALGVGVQDVAGQGLQLRDDDGPGDAGNDDLALGIGGIEAVGGNLAAVLASVETCLNFGLVINWRGILKKTNSSDSSP